MIDLAVVSGAAAGHLGWDDYVQGSPHAHAYHQAGWSRVFSDSFGQKTHYLMSTVGGAINGVLPLVRVRSRMFGDFLVSMPHLSYGGPCADNLAIACALVERAVELARQLGVRHLELRTEQALPFGLRSRAEKVSIRLQLPSSPGELWERFPTKLRTKIRRAQQEKVEFRAGRTDLLEAFYEVFSINMRDLGTPVYGKNFFRNILEAFPDGTWVGCVFREGEPIAAGFLIGFRKTIEIPWGSSLKRYNRLNPNLVLYWNLLQASCERSYSTFDFGRSSPNSGPYAFKAQWGAAAFPLEWQYWVHNDGPLPDLTPHNPRFKLAVNVWKRLPLPVTRLIGPHIVKNIP
jgi:FemAB-related protein (PEP-CTERM system-associated)